MTIVIAVTGELVLGNQLLQRGCKKRNKNSYSDQQVSLIYKNPKRSFINHLRNIGLGMAIKQNKINKTIIRDEIFYNKKTKLELERYIFKEVRKKRSNFIKHEKKRKSKVVFLDIPLLFENNLSKKFDIVISIISKKERFKRLKKNRKITKELFNKIIKSQTSDLARKKNSDIVIYNNRSMKDYLKKIHYIRQDTDLREIVIDTETTGLNYKSGDRIIEVGCVELKITFQQVKHYSFIVIPTKTSQMELKI